MSFSPESIELGNALRSYLLESHKEPTPATGTDAVTFLKERATTPDGPSDALAAALIAEHEWMADNPYEDDTEHRHHAKMHVTLFVASMSLSPKAPNLEFNDGEPIWLDADALARIRRDLADAGE